MRPKLAVTTLIYIHLVFGDLHHIVPIHLHPICTKNKNHIDFAVETTDNGWRLVLGGVCGIFSDSVADFRI